MTRSVWSRSLRSTRRSQKALLRAQPPVASRPLQPRAAAEEQQSAGYDRRAERRVSHAARSRDARRIFSGRERHSAPSKDAPPELLEEVFELNMALEELRDGDESARPATGGGSGAVSRACCGEIDDELEGSVCAVR